MNDLSKHSARKEAIEKISALGLPALAKYVKGVLATSRKATPKTIAGWFRSAADILDKIE